MNCGVWQRKNELEMRWGGVSVRCARARQERKIPSFARFLKRICFVVMVLSFRMPSSDVAVFCLRGNSRNCSGSPRERRQFLELRFRSFAAVAVVFCRFWGSPVQSPVLLAYLASGATLEIPLPIAYSSRNLGHVAHGPSQRGKEGRKEGRSGHSNCNYFICVKTSVVGR